MSHKWPDDFVNKVVNGEALEVMKEIPAGTIDMCMTSPPYWGLRDYGVEQIFGGGLGCKHDFNISHRRRNDKSGGHGNKEYLGAAKSQDGARFGLPTKTCSKCHAWKGQLGLEPTPELYIEHLMEIFSEVKRVLKKEGTLWLNIGDTYGGDSPVRKSGVEQFDPEKQVVLKKSAGGIRRGASWKKNRTTSKCLSMIPERLAFSLIQDGWILRNKIIWYKPNAMPSSVTDRFSNRYEFIYMFSTQQKYYFDLGAVRKAYTEPLNRWGGATIGIPKKTKWKSDDEKAKWAMSMGERQSRPNPGGKNPGDVFEINTQSFPEAHFAVFPEKLCEKPIKAGCPEEVCKKCGKARQRIVEPTKEYKKHLGKSFHDHKDDAQKGQRINIKVDRSEYITIGWTSCSCNAGFESGIVLDPFAGAGTTLYVAKEMMRRYVGIEINEEFCKMCEKRLAQGVLDG